MYKYRNIGLITKSGGNGVSETLVATREHLLAAGAKVLLDENAAALLNVPDASSARQIGESCEVAIVIGGDGTLLGAARALAPFAVPLIGVNLGRLGFLVDVPPSGDLAVLDAVLCGEHLVERRSLLTAEVVRDGQQIFQERALNDVVLRIRERVRLLEFETYVDGRFVSLQRADGMIAASPTGSTAYALSSGGPVLTPDMQAIVLLPICSHTFSSRPVVVRDDSLVELLVRDDNRDAAQLVCDGQVNFRVHNDDRIRIRRADESVTLLHPEGHDFYELLREKLNWG